MPEQRRFALPVLLLVLFVALSACKRTPILEVEELPLNAPAGVSLAQVGETIERAGSALGWTMTELDSGNLRAAYQSRGGKHRTVVVIRYSLTSLTMEHGSSFNLNYKTERSITYIHPVYNTWVAQLRDRILRDVAAISP